MSISIEAMACFVPGLILNRLAQRPSRFEQGADRISGAVLFSDISGFTALTERLSQRGPVGAEQLSELLNAYFGRLMSLISDHGGDVLKLAGDALVALWPASAETLPAATLRAAQCSLAIQETLTDYPAAEGILLRSKMGIGVGDVLAMYVGGVLDRWELLISGTPLVQMGLAECLARPRDVVLSPEAWEQLRDACVGTPIDGGHVRLESVTKPLPTRAATLLKPTPEVEPALRGYIPVAIQSRLDAGQTEWLSELRRVTVLFVSLSGLNSTTTDGLEQTHLVIRALQSALYRFEGSVNKLSVDEKGLTLVAALGLPPLAHEDDALRGVQAALEIQTRLHALNVQSSVGVATGRVYCGEIGWSGRREYTVIGDTVNLAARLMQAAKGGILCDSATHQTTKARFAFETLPPVTLKGKANPVAIFRPSGQLATPSSERRLFGRAAEREHLGAGLDALVSGHSSLITLEGDAGLGKSRLVAELVEQAAARGVTTLIGEGDVIEKSTPYYAWRPVVTGLLGVGGLESPDERRERVFDRFRADPELIAQAPLLNAFLALDLPENELTEQLAGQVRADNTNELLLRLLQEAASERATVLVLEDTHWFDSASWALTLLVARRIRPLLIVIASRPMVEPLPADVRAVLNAPGIQRLHLDTLPPDDALALACDRLGVDLLPPPAAALIQQKAQGNPFFIEELAYAVRESGLIRIADGICEAAPGVDWNAVSFPDSIQGVVTTRIDRLPPSQQLTLKVASVIGRLFTLRILRDVFPIEQERHQLPNHLDTLERLDFTLVDAPDPDLSYIFKHIIIQEVSYNLLLFSHRRQLHSQIATWYEESQGEDLSPHYPLLAHHWSRAEDEEKAITYLGKAGEQALRGGAYHEAVEFLREALARDERGRNWYDDWGDRSRRVRWEAGAGAANLGLGRLAESREHTERALWLMGRLVPHTPLQFTACYFQQVGRQAAHRIWPTRFLGRSREDGEVLLQAAGAFDVISQVCYYAQDISLGVYAALRALNLAERVGPSPELARCYATMCVAASLIPLHRLAEIYSRRAQEVAEVIDDVSTQAWVSALTGIYWIGIGRWGESREKLTQSVEMTRRIGDWRRWEESLGELARLHLLKGEYAQGEEGFGQLWEMARHHGHDQAKIWGRHGQATAILRQGRVEEAAAMLDQSPALRDESARCADAILGLGLLASARLRLGQLEAAEHSAKETLRRIRSTRATANYNFEGYSGAAEAFLGLWESSLTQAGRSRRNVKRNARHACAAFSKFAHIFPMAQPRAWIWQGLYYWLGGRPSSARTFWKRALESAARFEMLFDEGLAHFELGRHAEAGDPARAAHLDRAREIFAQLGAADDLARVESMTAGSLLSSGS